LKDKIGNSNLEIIAVLNNLKLPFDVQQTIHINKFDAEKINVDKSKTYIMVCQRGLNSYRAAVKLKNKYPDLEVLSLTGGISNY
jgi:rhodanese-related sulfurtransferase